MFIKYLHIYLESNSSFYDIPFQNFKMDALLKRLGMRNLEQRFADEKIDLDNILSLSDQDLTRIGVSTIGERARLRKEALDVNKQSEIGVDRELDSDTRLPSLRRPTGSRPRSIGLGINSVYSHRNSLFSGRSGRKANRAKCKTRARGWTVSAICLSDKDQDKVPSSDIKEQLFKAGLGLKKIRLDMNDDVNEVMDKLSTDELNSDGDESIGFPQLKNCGGYELLKCQSNNRTLSVIDCDWNTKSLKAVLGAQAKIFIRPIQQNLPLEPKRKVKENEDPSLDQQAIEKCRTCGESVPIVQLRQHCLSCITPDSGNIDASKTNDLSVYQDAGQDDQTELPDPGLFQVPTARNESLSVLTRDESFSGSASTSTVTGSTETILYFVSNQPTEMFETSGTTSSYSNIQNITSNNYQPMNVIATSTTAIYPGDLSTENPSDIDLVTANTRELSAEATIQTEKNTPMVALVSSAISYCITQKIDNPVEILRYLQSVLVTGRNLEVHDPSQVDEGSTSFILVDRENIIETAFDEINGIENVRDTLEVQFYDEVAIDYGGPRKEFFRLVISAVMDRYFNNGLREHMAIDYKTVGKVISLSILQNGTIPHLDENIINEIFFDDNPSPCIRNLQMRLDILGIRQVGKQLPMFLHLLRPNSSKTMTYKLLTHLLKPSFSEEGSNARMFESSLYAAFVRYLRTAASGRREGVTLSKVLQFATGASEEPVLGFTLHPSIDFHEVLPSSSFLPTANTCINCLKLARASLEIPQPPDNDLFMLFDYAFCNTYYGLH
ncbi:uncharacterized protein LOC117333620 [Pecten maximus]|uniref:uncharacterized protein LOC117333620 n=1 Tax=Pecten maximus TaxID=6579 RepID=UPI001457F545|nr:uncharacterized protein LOC117333620 [Pecten maximus]